MEQNPRRLLVSGLAVLAAVWLTARYLLPVGLPFLLGLGLARLAQPGLRLLNRRLPRGISAALSVTLLLALAGLLFWGLGRILLRQAQALTRSLPELVASLGEPARALQKRLLAWAARLPPAGAQAGAQWIRKFFGGGTLLLEAASGWALKLASGVAARLPDITLFLFTMLLSAYFLAPDLPGLRARALGFLPPGWQTRGGALVKKLRTGLRGYIRAQLRLSALSLGLLTGGLLVLGQKSAFLLGLVISLVDMLPVFGVGTVLLPWSLLSFLRGSTSMGVGLALLYLLILLTRSALEPRMVGRQMGLPPLLTLFSIYAGFRLFGVLGMLLLPLALMVLRQILDQMNAA